MEPNKDEKKDNVTTSTSPSPAERVNTPCPAQEIFPLDQSSNDGKQKGDMDKLKEYNEQSRKK